ncbi:MAG TPA: CheR family methyltransferase [Bacteroidales bacterium]|nr:CheR family methyltransferase [Bacteroidales bacterium]
MEIYDVDVKNFQKVIREHSVYDLNEYSVNSLKRRLIKIVQDYDNDIGQLIEGISSDENLLEDVIKKITVNTTELFRDPPIWKNLIEDIIPKLKFFNSLNIWHAGCSTGQEVYSMMMLLDHYDLLDRANIYASDINSDVLDIARQGEYRLQFNRAYIDNFNTVFPENVETEKRSSNQYEKYFTIDETRDKIIMNDFLKKKPTYEKIDLVKDDNLFYVNFDLILCRNVIIYFNNALQTKVLELFHRNLRDKGFLILGMHESIMANNYHLFTKYDAFYRKH